MNRVTTRSRMHWTPTSEPRNLIPATRTSRLAFNFCAPVLAMVGRHQPPLSPPMFIRRHTRLQGPLGRLAGEVRLSRHRPTVLMVLSTRRKVGPPARTGPEGCPTSIHHRSPPTPLMNAVASRTVVRLAQVPSANQRPNRISRCDKVIPSLLEVLLPVAGNLQHRADTNTASTRRLRRLRFLPPMHQPLREGSLIPIGEARLLPRLHPPLITPMALGLVTASLRSEQTTALALTDDRRMTTECLLLSQLTPNTSPCTLTTLRCLHMERLSMEHLRHLQFLRARGHEPTSDLTPPPRSACVSGRKRAPRRSRQTKRTEPAWTMYAIDARRPPLVIGTVATRLRLGEPMTTDARRTRGGRMSHEVPATVITLQRQLTTSKITRPAHKIIHLQHLGRQQALPMRSPMLRLLQSRNELLRQNHRLRPGHPLRPRSQRELHEKWKSTKTMTTVGKMKRRRCSLTDLLRSQRQGTPRPRRLAPAQTVAPPLQQRLNRSSLCL